MSQPRALLIVLGLWALIYLPGLGTLEIKGEEGRRILPAVTMLRTGNFIVPQIGSDPYFTKPPLINWLVAASFKLTGQHDEWSARLPSAFCVLAVALAFVTIGRRTLGASGSLIAALVWMTNFGIVEKGRLIEIEALYVSLTGLAFIFWMSWWEERRSPWLTWTVPWIFLGLGWLAKGPLHLVFFYAVVVGVLWSHRPEGGPAPREPSSTTARRSRWSRPAFGPVVHPAHAVGILIMLGIFAAWAIPCLMMMPASDVAQTWTRQFSGRVTGEDFKFGGWILNVPRGLGYFLPWTLLLLFFRRNAERPTPNAERRMEKSGDAASENSAFDVGRSAFGVQTGLAWGIALSFLGVSLLPGSLARYTMPLLAPAAWLMASLLTSTRFELPRWLRLRRPAGLPSEWRWPAIVTALVCGAMLVYAVGLMPMLRKREKVRNIAAQINAVLPAGVPLYAIDPDYQPALFYVRDPIVYHSRVGEVPANARFLLVQPADVAEALRRGRERVRLRDYRKKELIVVELQ